MTPITIDPLSIVITHFFIFVWTWRQWEVKTKQILSMSEREYKRMGREKQRAIMKEKEDEEVEKLFCISFFPLTMLEMLLAEE